MELRPRVRADLRLALGPDGEPGEIFDDLYSRRVGLGAIGNALMRRLDGQRTVAELEAAIAELGLEVARVGASLRSFFTLHLVEGAGDETRQRIRDLGMERELPYRSLPDARFACQGSGQCCRSYRLGPLSASEVARLSALPLREKMPHLPSGLFFWCDENEDEGVDHFLRSVGTKCVFLLPDERCGIHAHFGSEQKPATCRFFPIELQLTIEGARVYDKGHCATHFVSAAAGESVIETFRLSRSRAGIDMPLFHPIVFFAEDTPGDFSLFLQLEADWRRIVDEGDPLEAPLRCLRRYESFTAALRTFPLAAGEPGKTLAAWGSERAEPTPEPMDVREAALKLVEFFSTMTLVLGSYLGEAHAVGGVGREASPLVSEAMPLCSYLASRAQAIAGDPDAGLDPLVEACSPAPDEDFVGALRRSLRTHFYGRPSLPEDRPVHALGRTAMALACAFVGAQHYAAADGRPYRVADLSRGHMLAMRPLAHSVDTVLKQDPAALLALCTLLPRLAGWRPSAQSGTVAS